MAKSLESMMKNITPLTPILHIAKFSFQKRNVNHIKPLPTKMLIKSIAYKASKKGQFGLK